MLVYLGLVGVIVLLGSFLFFSIGLLNKVPFLVGSLVGNLFLLIYNAWHLGDMTNSALSLAFVAINAIGIGRWATKGLTKVA